LTDLETVLTDSAGFEVKIDRLGVNFNRLKVTDPTDSVGFEGKIDRLGVNFNRLSYRSHRLCLV
jgi:hypothetical protein